MPELVVNLQYAVSVHRALTPGRVQFFIVFYLKKHESILLYEYSSLRCVPTPIISDYFFCWTVILPKLGEFLSTRQVKSNTDNIE